MARWILLALVAFVIWGFWRSRSARKQDDVDRSPAAKAPGQEAMRRCAECGVHLPDSLTLPGRGGHFCSLDHRQRFEARQSE
jgi:uncharacterized protein